jgi:hypothetical protein
MNLEDETNYLFELTNSIIDIINDMPESKQEIQVKFQVFELDNNATI